MTEKRDGSGRHRVVLGDDLRSLAEHYYGDADRWRQLWYANRAFLANETTLIPGESLIIPDEALLSTARPEPGPEPVGFVGSEGSIGPPVSGDARTSVVAPSWPLPRPRSTTLSSMPAPVAPRPRSWSFDALPRLVQRLITSTVVIVIMFGAYSIVDTVRKGSEPEKILDLPGVAIVDGEERRVWLSPEVTQEQARDVLHRVFRLDGEWQLIAGPAYVPVVHGGPINTPDDLYPNIDLMVRIADELPEVPSRSITIDSSYRIMAAAHSRTELIETSRTLAEIIATDGHGMAMNELRVVEGAVGRSVTVAEHLGVTEADDVGAILGALTRIPDFGVVDLADRYRVVLRASQESEIGRSCRSADKVFDDLDLTVDLEVTVGKRYGNARPCPR